MTIKSAKTLFRNLSNKKGQGMAEYVFIVGFIALVVVASLTPVGTVVANKFTAMVAIVNGTR